MFPDDYKRVQQAGGTTAQIMVQTGLPRQLLVDEDLQQLKLMDGSTPGGRGIVMTDRFLSELRALPGGSYASAGGILGSGQLPDTNTFAWSPAILRQLFETGFTFFDSYWLVKNGALPTRLREYTTEQNDPNLATQNGYYMINPSFATNLPSGAPTSSTIRMMLEVIAQSAANGVQILYARDGTNRVWRRTFESSTFAAWVLSDGITSTDLANLLALAGGTMTGKINTAASTGARAGLNIPVGTDPAAPFDGDVWQVGTNLNYQIAGVTRQILHTGKVASDAQILTGEANLVVTPLELKEAMPELMFGKWQDMASSRTTNTTYQNLTGRHLMVAIGSANNSSIILYSADGTNFVHLAGDSGSFRAFAIIPPGGYYQGQYSLTGEFWMESVGAY